MVAGVDADAGLARTLRSHWARSPKQAATMQVRGSGWSTA
jgi:hypothetical protein